MSFHIEETWKSGGEVTYGQQNVYHLIYKVWSDDGVSDDADDAATVIAWALNQTSGYGQIALSVTMPDSYQIGYIANFHPVRIAEYYWQIEVEYRPLGEFRYTGQHAFSFSTAGEQKHISNGLAHVAAYTSAGSSATINTKAALNFDNDGNVQGIEIPGEGFSFQLIMYLDAGQLTETYVTLLKQLKNSVCSQTFTATIDGVTFTFAEGEVRFDGATGALCGYGDWEVTLNFSTSQNFTMGAPLTVGPISGIVKHGWDYMSIHYKASSNTSDNILESIPAWVSIDQVFLYLNWTGIAPGVF